MEQDLCDQGGADDDRAGEKHDEHGRPVSGIGKCVIKTAMLTMRPQRQKALEQLALAATLTNCCMLTSSALGIFMGSNGSEVRMSVRILDDSGGEMGGRCQFNRLLDTSAKPVEAHGYCTYTDADNDQIFEKCDFLPGQPNTCELTGIMGRHFAL
jgi:hypothetical protein